VKYNFLQINATLIGNQFNFYPQFACQTKLLDNIKTDDLKLASCPPCRTIMLHQSNSLAEIGLIISEYLETLGPHLLGQLRSGAPLSGSDLYLAIQFSTQTRFCPNRQQVSPTCTYLWA